MINFIICQKEAINLTFHRCTEIIIKENISLVIPASDEEALALSKNPF